MIKSFVWNYFNFFLKNLFFRTSKSSIGPSIGPQIEVPDAFKEVAGVASDKWDGWVLSNDLPTYVIYNLKKTSMKKENRIYFLKNMKIADKAM